MSEIFNSVAEAKAALEESGILRQNLSPAVNGSFHIEGYFTPKDLEAILYLYRNNDPLVLPEKDANGLPKDDPTAGVLNRKTFMELLGVTPESTGDEIASKLRAARLAIFGEPKDKLQDFRSETVFPLAVGRPAYKMTDMHGDRGVICEVWPDDQKPLEGVAPEVEVIIDQDSIDRRLIPTGNAVLNRMLTEGGGLRRGDLSQPRSAKTDRSKTQVSNGSPFYTFEKGDEAYESLADLLKKACNFQEEFPGMSVEHVRVGFLSLEVYNPLFLIVDSDGTVHLCRNNDGVNEALISIKELEYSDSPGKIVVAEHASAVINYKDIKPFIKAFKELTIEKCEAAVAKHGGTSLGYVLIDITDGVVEQWLLTAVAKGE